MLLRSFRLALAAWRQGLRTRPGWTLAAVGLVVACEVLGRAGTNDVADASWMLALAVFMGCLTAANREREIAWWKPVLEGWAALRARVPELGLELGVDLRQEPPIARGWPRRFVWTLIVGGAASVLIGVAGALLPDGLRLVGVHSSFSLYLVALGLLWVAASLIVFFCAWFVLELARELARSGRRDPDRPAAAWRRFLANVWVATCVVTLVAAPVRWALGLVLACLLARTLTALTPGRPHLPVAWTRRGGGEPRAFSWEHLLVCEIAFYALVLFVFVLPLRGADVWGLRGPLTAMPISAFLGRVALWTGAWMITGVTVRSLQVSFVSRFRNPERPVRPRLYLEGVEDAATGRHVATSPAAAGFRVVWGAHRRKRGDVRVQVAATADPWEPGFVLGLDALDDAETARRLLRRNEIAQRRALLRGLERVLKRAAAVRFEHGTGFFVAPNLWFEMGIRRDARDEEEERRDEESSAIDDHFGPSYALLLSRAARHHFYRVMRGVSIDALFVQDGVGFRRLRPVLKILFELYDVHGGEQEALDRHFSLVPGVHVIVHDFELSAKPDLHGYPEPKYREISRARILHVFRSRGGEEDPVLDDSPRERVPLLV